MKNHYLQARAEALSTALISCNVRLRWGFLLLYSWVIAWKVNPGIPDRRLYKSVLSESVQSILLGCLVKAAMVRKEQRRRRASLLELLRRKSMASQTRGQSNVICCYV